MRTSAPTLTPKLMQITHNFAQTYPNFAITCNNLSYSVQLQLALTADHAKGCMAKVVLQVLCFLLFWLFRPPGLFEPPCCDLPLFLYSLLSFWVLPVSGAF